MLRFLAPAAALLMATAAHAQPVSFQDRVGDAYEIRLRSTTESASDDGRSTSNSRSGGLLIERVVAVRDEGLELEFDLPPDVTAEDRAREWQWPARVLRSADGSMQLVNAAELEARVEAWLADFEIPRESCGHWIFTWTAYKIECDPQSVLGTIQAFDLRFSDLREGATYPEVGGLGPATLLPRNVGPEGSTFAVETPIDPEFARRERAEQDVVVAEIMNEPTTLEAAILARQAEGLTGTIATTLVTDAEGRIVERTTVTELVVTDANGGVERMTTTNAYQRRPINRLPR